MNRFILKNIFIKNKKSKLYLETVSLGLGLPVGESTYFQ